MLADRYCLAVTVIALWGIVGSQILDWWPACTSMKAAVDKAKAAGVKTLACDPVMSGEY